MSPTLAMSGDDPQETPTMQSGRVGLGRMGANMARRLLRGGHEVVVTNRSLEPVEHLTAEGASGARTVGELVERLQAPRAIWVSLPAGEVTEDTLTQLAPGSRAAYVQHAIRDKLIAHKQYVNRHGEDMLEIRDWRWSLSTAARSARGRSSGAPRSKKS